MGADDKLYGGKIASNTDTQAFDDSMAEEMEKAYNQVLAENGKAPLPGGDRTDLRMMFIAISRGMINHLQKKQKAIKVSVAATNVQQTVTPQIDKR